MISLTAIKTALVDDWVVFEVAGTVVSNDAPSGVGPAGLLVSVVTDAMKRVEDGFVVDSVSRDDLWALEAFVLNRVVLKHLGDGEVSPEELIEAVREAGFSWQVSPTSAL